MEGKFILSPALAKPDPAIPGDRIEEKISMRNGNYILSGTRLFVPFGHVADLLLYEVDTDKGKTLFLIDAKSPGITCTPLDSIAADKPCEVNLEDVEVLRSNILGEIGKGQEIIDKMEQSIQVS